MLGEITFEDAEPASGWLLTVSYRDTVIGHIRQSLDSYGYYNGAQNSMSASLTDTDIERLKEKIRATHGLAGHQS